MLRREAFVVASISVAVLLASSTWFAGTAVARVIEFGGPLDANESAALTTSTQLGFVVGTIGFALFNLADRFAARRVFALSALACALANAGFALLSESVVSAAAFRFVNGAALAGVYPVGMKLVASWSPRGLGARLGLMVGALAFGTGVAYGFDAILGSAVADVSWRTIAGCATPAALVAAGIVSVLPDGPMLRARSGFDPRQILHVFRDRDFRANSLGYFGHMWELYALWSLLPLWLDSTESGFGRSDASWIAFGVLTAGALGCVAGGFWSSRIGSLAVARLALALSALACLASPFAHALPPAALVAFLLVWGVVVVADSPQFSALATRYCPPEFTATALTVQNGVGFALTVVSIQTMAALGAATDWRFVFVALAPGPLLGLFAMRRLKNEEG